MIDQIAYNVENTRAFVDRAVADTKKAVQLKGKVRRVSVTLYTIHFSISQFYKTTACPFVFRSPVVVPK
jgi:t-SNARE complex subunit (syntaxin)